MSFKQLRERRHLSQERLADISGLSLRTVQRLEAGHRVSYATLRTLAVALAMDVDALERALYAAPHAPHDFVELPRWIRRLRAGLADGAPGVARRQAIACEAFAIGIGLLLLLAALLASSRIAVLALQWAGIASLACGYGVSIATRVVDRYRGWDEGTEATPSPAAAVAHRRGQRAFLYAAALLLPPMFLWMIVRIAG